MNTDQDKVTYDCYSLLKWIKTYPFEYEFVGMHFPMDTTEQQLYFEHVLNRTENPQYQYYLRGKREHRHMHNRRKNLMYIRLQKIFKNIIMVYRLM